MNHIVGRNIIVLLVLLVVASCGKSNKSQEDIQKDWELFENEAYAIKYPPAWKLSQSGYLGTSFLIVSKQTSIRDFYQENVSLNEVILEGDIDLKSYVQQDIDLFKKDVVKFVLEEELMTGIDGAKVYQLAYTGYEGINKITVKKQYQLKNNKIYILTFSGKTIEIKRYGPIGDGILNSFTLK
ncbi:MAG: PsbP-related protein [Prolixibacteraceae bacterium]